MIFLYCSVNSSNKLVKIDLESNERMTCTTKAGPRTMVLSDNQRYLYVVNYFTDSFQKVDAKTMEVVETIETGHHPIGITANWETSEIWVACYEGKIQIFKDSYLDSETARPSELIVAPEKVDNPEDEMVLKTNLDDEVTVVEEPIVQNKIKSVPTYRSIVNLEAKRNELAKRPLDTNSVGVASSTLQQSENSSVVVDKTNASNCKYHLIIGSFGVKANAEKLKNQMIAKGYSAQLLPSANQKMTMVSIQCFDSESKANKSKSQILSDSKQSGWVYGG